MEILAEGSAGKFELEIEAVWVENVDGVGTPDDFTATTRLANVCQIVKPVEFTEADFEEYIRATWYVQKQQETGYQKKEDLYCGALQRMHNGRVGGGGAGATNAAPLL